MRKRTYDIILYGATSHTSKFIIPHFVNENLNIALAARDGSKIDAYGLPTLSCEIKDIDRLTKNTKILLNCVGPYSFTGEEIVRSCVNNKTHYLDISGETEFVNRIKEKFNEEARSNGVYIVNCCGFDSVPADLGVEYLKDVFNGEIEVESTITVKNPVCNKATWVSLINSLSNYAKSKNSNQLSKKVKEFEWSKDFNAYRVLFRGIDHSVVKRTQELFDLCGQKGASYVTYIKIGNSFNLFLYFFYFTIIRLLCRFSLGKSLLIKFYSIFSFGIVKENPPKEVLNQSSFEMKFTATSINRDINIVRELKISGPDPGLTFTGICASQCAITFNEIINILALKPHLQRIRGGSVTPGFIFKGSNLLTRLQMKGIKFE